MKNLILSLLAASVLFVIGCQENPITDPIADQPVEKPQVGIPDTYLHGSIRLQSALKDPYPIMNSYYIINGTIDYDYRIFFADPMPPAPQRYASIYMTIEADFRYLCTVCTPSPEDDLAGFISEVSEELVPLGGNYVSLLEKTYTISGRNDGMVLKARFAVTDSDISLSAMWLALPNANELATDINHY